MSLLRLLPSTAHVTGSAEFDGVDLLSAPLSSVRRVRGREIAFVFQEPMTSLNPAFRIGNQIGEVLKRHLGLRRAEARNRTIELLDLVRIPAPERRVDEYPHQLSGGMRQRVMIAMALACDPKILIADEPTTALDVTIQAGILDLLRDIRERLGTAIILITHNLGVVADIADDVIVMYAGRKAEEAPVHELFAAPQHPYTIGLLAAVPRPGGADSQGRLQEIPGRVPSLAELPTACAFAPRCPRADELSRTQVPELLEVRPHHLVACFHPGGAWDGR
jgi:peptide/nickel transport system ATP-binding protein